MKRAVKGKGEGNFLHRRSNSDSQFSDSFEERMILRYLNNIIPTKLAKHCSRDIFYFAIGLVGEQYISSMLSEVLPPDLRNAEIVETVVRTDRRTLLLLLREKILPHIRDKLMCMNPLKKTTTEVRLETLRQTFKLSDMEIDIITLYYFSGTGPIQKLFQDDEKVDLFSIDGFKNNVPIILNRRRHEVIRNLIKSKLINAGILCFYWSVNKLDLAEWCHAYLSGIGGDDINHEFFNREKASEHGLEEFELPEDERAVLETLMAARAGCNILFYGEPGTGKTSLAKSLGKAFHKTVFSVKNPADDDQRSKLRAIYATITAADKEDAIILIDEADEVLNTDEFMFSSGRPTKSWINNQLDDHDQKIIWITNKYNRIHPSTMRRFHFSLQFKKLTVKKRIKILSAELSRSKFRKLFTEDDLGTLCKEFSVDAGGLMNALKVLADGKKLRRESALARVRTVLSNHELATTGKRSLMTGRKDFSSYSLSGINCSPDLALIIEMAKKYASPGGRKNHRPLSILLYGLPGTGKSEFAYYLGHILNQAVVLKRSSDILGKYVGDTEANIAAAFSEAREEECILFFDEADSFLFPRQSAQRSYEISHTNEVLTQLDNHEGIVVFATNDMPGLDHAALRRFRFKVELMPLTPEGNVEIYRSLLLPLMPREAMLSGQETARLMNFRNLTPGDFAVVKDQFEFAEAEKITHDGLISALQNEIRYKQSGQNEIGFRNCI